MDDNPDRRMFLDKLIHFMEDQHNPITSCPTISKNPLDLFRLYFLVKERGGFLEVDTRVFIFSFRHFECHLKCKTLFF